MLVIYSWEGIKNLQHNKSSSSRFMSSYVVLKRSHYQTASTNIISPSLIWKKRDFFHFRGTIFLALQQPLDRTVTQQKFLVFFPKYFPIPLFLKLNVSEKNKYYNILELFYYMITDSITDTDHKTSWVNQNMCSILFFHEFDCIFITRNISIGPSVYPSFQHNRIKC